MNTLFNHGTKLCENIILVDADYIDKVAFDLIVNFERMLGRRIPPADTAHWLDCVALDGGIREGDNQVQVILIHDKQNTKLENFNPASYDIELNGKAFKDHLGEFLISALPVESMVSKEDFMADVLAVAVNHKDVRRIMVVPDAEKHYDSVRHALRYAPEAKHITVFAMQPMQGGNFRQEILGYSLMSALGISSDEISDCN